MLRVIWKHLFPCVSPSEGEGSENGFSGLHVAFTAFTKRILTSLGQACCFMRPERVPRRLRSLPQTLVVCEKPEPWLRWRRESKYRPHKISKLLKSQWAYLLSLGANWASTIALNDLQLSFTSLAREESSSPQTCNKTRSLNSSEFHQNSLTLWSTPFSLPRCFHWFWQRSQTAVTLHDPMDTLPLSSSLQIHPTHRYAMWLNLFFFFKKITFTIFWSHRMVCRIFIPQSGMGPALPSVAGYGVNHWSTREVLNLSFLKLILPRLLQRMAHFSSPHCSLSCCDDI